MLNNPLLKEIWSQGRGWLVTMLLLTIISAALYIYQHQLVDPKNELLVEQKTELQKQLRERQADLERSGVPISTVERMQEELQKFTALIPPTQKFADFIGELFFLADQSQLEIDSVSYRPEVNKETEFLHYEVTFSVQGTYDQLKQFIHLLENSKRILIIDKIAMTGKRDEADRAEVNLQIGLTTLFQEEQP